MTLSIGLPVFLYSSVAQGFTAYPRRNGNTAFTQALTQPQYHSQPPFLVGPVMTVNVRRV
jgi:hypothetical protein